jgi:hypothetical protein
MGDVAPFFGGFGSIVALLVWPPLYMNTQIKTGVQYFIKPQNCNNDFYGQGYVPPAWNALFAADANTLGPDGKNWWIDGEVGWRLSMVKTAANAKKERQWRFGLCPSYYGAHSDINCLNFNPDDDGEYPLATQVFEDMDLVGYNTSKYTAFGIPSASPFTAGVDRDSMLTAFEDWVDIGLKARKAVIEDAWKILWIPAIALIGPLCVVILEKVRKKEGVEGGPICIFFCYVALAVGFSILMGNSWTVLNRTAASPFAKSENWAAMFPYCESVTVATVYEQSSEKYETTEEKNNNYVYWRNGLNFYYVGIVYAVLVAFLGLPFLIAFGGLLAGAFQFANGSSSSSSSGGNDDEKKRYLESAKLASTKNTNSLHGKDLDAEYLVTRNGSYFDVAVNGEGEALVTVMKVNVGDLVQHTKEGSFQYGIVTGASVDEKKKYLASGDPKYQAKFTTFQIKWLTEFDEVTGEESSYTESVDWFIPTELGINGNLKRLSSKEERDAFRANEEIIELMQRSGDSPEASEVKDKLPAALLWMRENCVLMTQNMTASAKRDLAAGLYPCDDRDEDEDEDAGDEIPASNQV